MEPLGYFPVGSSRATGAETTPKPEGEVLVFESLFAASHQLPCHGLLVDVLDGSKVQIHQLTPHTMVALSKFVWASSTFNEGPSVEAFAKHYCLH